MERSTANSEVDEDVEVEALVKAAAWAWHERGLGLGGVVVSLSTSGSEPTKVAQQVFIRRRRRSRRPPQPSRFMLQEATNKNNKAWCNSPNRAAVPLLDAYEIERISRHIESLLKITPTSSGGKEEEEEGGSKAKSKEKKSMMRGWLGLGSMMRHDNNSNKDDGGGIRNCACACGENRMVKAVLVRQHRRRPPTPSRPVGRCQ